MYVLQIRKPSKKMFISEKWKLDDQQFGKQIRSRNFASSWVSPKKTLDEVRQSLALNFGWLRLERKIIWRRSRIYNSWKVHTGGDEKVALRSVLVCVPKIFQTPVFLIIPHPFSWTSHITIIPPSPALPPSCSRSGISIIPTTYYISLLGNSPPGRDALVARMGYQTIPLLK